MKASKRACVAQAGGAGWPLDYGCDRDPVEFAAFMNWVHQRLGADSAYNVHQATLTHGISERDGMAYLSSIGTGGWADDRYQIWAAEHSS